MTRVAGVIFFISLLIASKISYSQSISNVFASGSGDNIVISYDIEEALSGTSFRIEIFVSKDGGMIFEGPLKKVTGAVGPNITTLKNNQILWKVLEEYPILVSDKVVFEIRGTVENKIELSFEFIKGGEFTMGARDGDDNAKPTHKVVLDDFNIGKYEITQEQWYKIMGSNPSSRRNCPSCPVENVTYTEVLKFIEKLNKQASGFYYRLPTEAEWEYAAASAISKDRALFSGSNSIEAVAWYASNSGGTTHPVGEKSPNDLGLFDMSGNVSEWCNDYFSALYYRSSPAKNPPGPASGGSKVLRGGAWNQAAGFSRISNREYEVQTSKSSNIGFRLVKINNK